MNIKIHEAIALTAIAPLLNLNLNYEKLRRKYNKYFIICCTFVLNFFRNKR